MKLKTDLLNPKNFNRTQSELEEFLLLCIFVAGKSSKTQYKKLELFLDEIDTTNGIFDALSKLSIDEIKQKLIKVKAGQYNRLCGCLFILSRKNLDLQTCTCEELEAIPGIGMKTSRFFITYSRLTNSYAILDTHILKFIKENIDERAPKSTPTVKVTYKYWEDLFLYWCEVRNKNVADFDLEVWKSYARTAKNEN